MLKLKRHEIPESGRINMTPMIDVVFQLLIFFILTASIATPNQIEIQLPESTSGVKASSAKRVVVTYQPNGDKPLITLNAQPVDSLDRLGRMLTKMAAGRSKTPPVDIQIDRTVPYQDVVALIDTVRDAGFLKFSLFTLAKTMPVAGDR